MTLRRLPSAALTTALLAGASVAASAVPARAAGPRATPARLTAARCAAVRVDRFLHADPAGTFGAFHLTAGGVGCATARTVASEYVLDPAAAEHMRSSVAGWTCTLGSSTVAQEVAVTCRRGTRVIAFDDEIPSG